MAVFKLYLTIGKWENFELINKIKFVARVAINYAINPSITIEILSCHLPANAHNPYFSHNFHFHSTLFFLPVLFG